MNVSREWNWTTNYCPDTFKNEWEILEFIFLNSDGVVKVLKEGEYLVRVKRMTSIVPDQFIDNKIYDFRDAPENCPEVVKTFAWAIADSSNKLKSLLKSKHL